MPEKYDGPTIIAAAIVCVQLVILVAMWGLRRYFDRLISDLDKCRTDIDDLYKKQADCPVDRIEERVSGTEEDIRDLKTRVFK